MAALLPGQSPPATVITPYDHRGWIYIAGSVSLCLLLISLALRLHIRIRVRPPFGHDDTVLIVSTVLAVIQTALVFRQTTKGFGQAIERIEEDKLVPIQELGYATDLLYIIGLYLSKISTQLLITRLTMNSIQLIILRSMLACWTLFAVISIFIVALRCDLGQPWLQYGQECPGLFARWQVVAAFDIISEVGIFGGAVYLLVGLSMALAPKAKVSFAFAFRLPVIALAVLRLTELNKQIMSDDPTLVGAMACVWTLVELHYSNISSTIPCLNPLMSAFSTNFGAMGPETVIGKEYGSGYGHGSAGGSHALQSVRGPNVEIQNEPVSSELKLRPDHAPADRVATVTTGKSTDQHSVGSDDSTRHMIITKAVEWEIQTEGGRRTPADELGTAL